MPNCPLEVEIAAFMDGALPESESREIRRHAVQCRSCSNLLTDLLVLRDLETQLLLEQPSVQEASNMQSVVQASLRDVAAPQNPAMGQSILGSGVDVVLGTTALIGATLLEGLEKAFGNEPMPALGHKDEKNQERHVRNAPATHSSYPDSNMHAQDISRPIEHAPTVIGLPGVNGQSPDIQQHHSDTCAIRSQELILRDFGIQCPEDKLRQEAAARHWYTDGGGTKMNHVGDLLELHGVSVHKYDSANIFTLTSELAQGHKVIIGVNSSELWNHDDLRTQLFHHLGLGAADHALVVSGIDTSDANHVKVVLTDPGSGDIAKSYPIAQFVEAWKDSHCFMVATTNPAPSWLPEMAHFNYDLGHLESIGHLPYDKFVENFAHAEPNNIGHATQAHHELIESFAHQVGEEQPHQEPTIEELVREHLYPSSDNVSHLTDEHSHEDNASWEDQNDDTPPPDDHDHHHGHDG